MEASSFYNSRNIHLMTPFNGTENQQDQKLIVNESLQDGSLCENESKLTASNENDNLDDLDRFTEFEFSKFVFSDIQQLEKFKNENSFFLTKIDLNGASKHLEALIGIINNSTCLEELDIRNSQINCLPNLKRKPIRKLSLGNSLFAKQITVEMDSQDLFDILSNKPLGSWLLSKDKNPQSLEITQWNKAKCGDESDRSGSISLISKPLDSKFTPAEAIRKKCGRENQPFDIDIQ